MMQELAGYPLNRAASYFSCGNDNTYNDNTYNDNTYNDNTYNDNTYNESCQ